MSVTGMSNLVVALFLCFILGYALTKIARRFGFIGWRYKTTLVSGAVFLLCTIIEYAYDGMSRHLLLAQRPPVMTAIDVIQAVSVVVFSAVAIGFIDVVFIKRTRRKQ